MTKEMATSPEKGNFSKQMYKDILVNQGTTPPDQIDKAVEMLDWYDEISKLTTEREESEEFKKDNLEYDLRTSEIIINKAKEDYLYAQNIYSALCNNEFQKMDNWCILSDKTWSCSWRYAGGIAAHLVGEGDYIDFYCTGIRGDSDNPEVPNKYGRIYVSESDVTDEVRMDLRKLGWVVLEDKGGV